jgi:hypothetical protein
MEDFRRESLAKGEQALVGDNEKILLIRVLRGLFFRVFRVLSRLIKGKGEGHECPVKALETTGVLCHYQYTRILEAAL